MVNVKVAKGNDVSITCNSDASPPVPSAEITWKKDGEVVSDINDGVLSLSQVTTHAHSIYFLRLMTRKNINTISVTLETCLVAPESKPVGLPQELLI